MSLITNYNTYYLIIMINIINNKRWYYCGSPEFCGTKDIDEAALFNTRQEAKLNAYGLRELYSDYEFKVYTTLKEI